MNNLYDVIIKGRSFDKDDIQIMNASCVPIETVNLIIQQYGNIGVSIIIMKKNFKSDENNYKNID